MKPDSEVQLSFGTLSFIEGCVVGRIKHGVNVGKRETDELVSTIRNHFGEREYVYISERQEDYSVDPVQIRRLALELNFKAGAFVLPESRKGEFLTHERLFYRAGNTQVFFNLDEALEWGKLVLDPKEH